MKHVSVTYNYNKKFYFFSKSETIIVVFSFIVFQELFFQLVIYIIIYKAAYIKATYVCTKYNCSIKNVVYITTCICNDSLKEVLLLFKWSAI